MSAQLCGVIPAVVTPVDDSLAPDARKAVPYYRELLAGGADGLNVLGTTGEAMSFSAQRRAAFMEALVEAGVPGDAMMAGTGAASLDDAAFLTKRAFSLGFAAALVMPPFFFRDAGDDGIVEFYERLAERTSPPPRSILLYNFPAASGIAFHPELVDRLIARLPDSIGGIKDSSNDRALQQTLLAAHPQLRVFPSDESALLASKTAGAAGCISATIALSLSLARRALDAGDTEATATLACRRAAFEGIAMVPAMRAMIATRRGDATWELPMPPLQPLDARRREEIEAAFSRCV